MWPVAAVCVVIFATYASVVTTRYGYSDDYPTLRMAVSGRPDPWFGSSIIEVQSAGGRPLGGLLVQTAFAFAGTVDSLRFVRLAGVVGIVALALVLRWWLARNGIRRPIADLVATFVCVMPAFGVVASWAVLFASPYAALLAAGASVVATFATDERGHASPSRVVLGGAMLLTALIVYQPPAMFFWVFFAIALRAATQSRRRIASIVRAHAYVALVGMSAAFAASKIAADLANSSAPNTTRMSITSEPIDKLSWFVTRPLFRSLSLFEVHDSLVVAGVCVVLASGAILVTFARPSPRPVMSGVAAAAAIPLSFLPALIVEESNSYVFRTGIALTSVLALYACFGFLGLTSTMQRRLTRSASRLTPHVSRASVPLFAAVVAFTALTTSRHVSELVTNPQSKELGAVRAAVAELPDGVRRVAFVQIPWEESSTTWYSDELGLSSAARPWTGEPLILLLLEEQGRIQRTRPSIVTVPAGSIVPPGAFVIDIRRELTRDL